MLMKSRRRKMIAGIDLISTSDVAFLLLIFFIVSTVFAFDSGLPLLLPAAETARQAIRIRQSSVATLAVHADNGLTLDGLGIAVDHVRAAIEQRLLVQPELVVVLETHPDADYGMMVACLDELKLSDARRVSLKTSR